MSENTPTQSTQVAQDLQETVSSLRAVSVCHNLLDKGMFHYSYAGLVPPSLAFLASLHSSLKEKALAHPDADKVPELKALKGESNE